MRSIKRSGVRHPNREDDGVDKNEKGSTVSYGVDVSTKDV